MSKKYSILSVSYIFLTVVVNLLNSMALETPWEHTPAGVSRGFSERSTKDVGGTILYAGILEWRKRRARAEHQPSLNFLTADAMWPAALSSCNHDFPPLYPYTVSQINLPSVALVGCFVTRGPREKRLWCYCPEYEEPWCSSWLDSLPPRFVFVFWDRVSLYSPKLTVWPTNPRIYMKAVCILVLNLINQGLLCRVDLHLRKHLVSLPSLNEMKGSSGERKWYSSKFMLKADVIPRVGVNQTWLSRNLRKRTSWPSLSSFTVWPSSA